MMYRALIIGIDAYEDAPLSGCVNDAERIACALSNNDDGSANFDCHVHLGRAPGEILTPFLHDEVTALFASPAEAALLFFAGHGTFDTLDGYLVTQDAPGYDMFAMQKIFQHAAQAAHVKEATLILDCCYGGHLGNAPGRPTLQPEATLREGLSVLTASRATETSAETNGGGLFTSLVVAALDGGAADIVGNVTVPSIYSYVDQAMSAWDQRPLMKSNVARLSPLRRCWPSVTIAELKKLPEWFPTSDYVFPLNPSFEPSEEPKGHPNEKIFAVLQKCRDARLIVPVEADHLYYAAVNSKACRLTPSGRFYWQLGARRACWQWVC